MTRETAENFAMCASGSPIVACATPRGRSAIAMVRGSGKNIVSIFQSAIYPNKNIEELEPNKTVMIIIRIGDITDKGMITVYYAPNSYTGEDMVELSVHGNPVLVDLILKECIKSGMRLALPGEFTLRALLNGKMDLMEAESVRATVEARTERALSAVRRSIQMHPQIKQAKQDIWNILVEISAMLEFPEDEVPKMQQKKWSKKLIQTKKSLSEFFYRVRDSKILTEGMQIVVAGESNVGKSTLFNRIIGAERAIVTPHPGTTTDIIEATVEISGVPVKILDTAGLRHSQHPVEIEGIKRARNVLDSADILLWVVDASKPPQNTDIPSNSIVILNKIDLGICEETIEKFPHSIKISALTTQGMDKLLKRVEELFEQIPNEAMVISVRVESLLKDTIAEIEQALDAMTNNYWDVTQISIENADTALGKIFLEQEKDIYDEIFSRFCVGK